MESNYESKYSGEQVDAAVEYFLRHSQTEESSYEYSNTIFCESTSGCPAPPFNNSSLPCTLPEFPFAGTDGKLWRDVPNSQSKNWYQCVIKINNKSKKVVTQGTVLDMQGKPGNDGTNGTDGQDGTDGSDGDDGKNGNYTEFRYKRSSSYALTLTSTQKTARQPAGWVLNWDEADIQTYAQIKSLIVTEFDKWLRTFSSQASASSNAAYFMTNLSSTATFTQIDNQFNSLYEERLAANDQQKTIIVACHKDFKLLYDDCTNSVGTQAEANDKYHSLYKEYIDNDHFWVLFQISAVIDGTTNALVSQWTNPQRIQGVDGKPGPSGSNGISGIPGVSISVAFTIGDANGPRPDAVNPLSSPYKDNYSALLAPDTNWTRESPTVSTIYPYIWFTQCRYILENGVYKFEDAWSAPQRYTGLNGITTHETVYTRNPIIYPAGIFTLNTTYANDGTRTPYVYYEGNYYYLSGQGTFTSDRSTSNPATATAWWTLMEHFEAIFAQVGIIANGLIGSMVFNEEFVFSQQGVDHDGKTSTHYEYFRKHYNTNALLTNPYDDNAAFRPNFCLNCKTGEAWSVSRDTAISNASSSIIQTAANISLQVKEEINGSYSAAGIDITSGRVKIIGDLEGESNGTFKGDISAKSLNVVDDSGEAILKLVAYDSETMGIPPSDTTKPADGTPVMIVNFGGKQLIVNTTELSHENITYNYVLVPPDSGSINILTSKPEANGNAKQGTSYGTIGTAPYLKQRIKSSETGVTITAQLDVYNGSTLVQSNVPWNSYVGRVYHSNPLSKDNDKTDIDAGKLVYKLDESKLLTLSGTCYLGQSTSWTCALLVASYWVPASCNRFQRCTCLNGKVTTANSWILIGGYYSYYYSQDASGRQTIVVQKNSTSYSYYSRYTYERSATQYGNTNAPSKSSYYYGEITSAAYATEWTLSELGNNMEIYTNYNPYK